MSDDLRRKDDPGREQDVRFCDACDREYGSGIADKGDTACSACGSDDAPWVYLPAPDRVPASSEPRPNATGLRAAQKALRPYMPDSYAAEGERVDAADKCVSAYLAARDTNEPREMT